jgi:hypothetical protein
MGLKQLFIGEGDRYNYMDMMVPNNPFSKGKAKKVNFYAKGKQGGCSINISTQYVKITNHLSNIFG